MTCKGICVRYKAQKPVGTGRYASGQRRCQICEIFIIKYKAKLRARVEADSITERKAEAIAIKA
jgi:hypothetical protein